MVSSRILSQSVGFSDMTAAYYTGKMSTVLHSCRLERQGEYEFSPKITNPTLPQETRKRWGQPIHFTVQPTTNDERPTTVGYFVLPPSVFSLSLAAACAAASRAVRTRNGEQET